MWWHPSPIKHSICILTRPPFAHNIPQRINIIQIPINNLRIFTVKCINYFCQYGVVGKKIVRIKHTDYVAGSTLNAFIHSIINTIIWLRNKMVDIIFELVDNLNSIIGRTSINYYKFDIFTGLFNDRPDTLLYGTFAIENDGNYGNGYILH